MNLDDSRLKKKEEHEIIMDEVYGNKNKNGNNIKEEFKNMEKEPNNNKQDNKKGEEVPSKTNDIQSKDKKYNLQEEKVIQITNISNNKVENVNYFDIDPDELKTKYVNQFQKREELFLMADIDLNKITENEEIPTYKKIL